MHVADVYRLGSSGGVIGAVGARSRVVYAVGPWLNPGSPVSHLLDCMGDQAVHPCELTIM